MALGDVSGTTMTTQSHHHMSLLITSHLRLKNAWLDVDDLVVSVTSRSVTIVSHLSKYGNLAQPQITNRSLALLLCHLITATKISNLKVDTCLVLDSVCNPVRNVLIDATSVYSTGCTDLVDEFDSTKNRKDTY